MKWLYGISDATVSCMTSGGQEYCCVNSLLCGIPLACTNYSSGADFCTNPFVEAIDWHIRFENQSSFIKAANDIGSIKRFIRKAWKMSEGERSLIGEQSRDWAVKTFSVETIGKQWEDVFDALPFRDWSSITLVPKLKNPQYPMPSEENNEAWVKLLYNNILLCEPDPQGFKHWLQSLANGTPRDAIYQFFCEQAREDNAKSEPPKDFGSLFDDNGRKRILFVLRESGGDLFISTSVLSGLKKLYPDADLYFACDPKFADILAGNSDIHKVIPYNSAMDSELAMRHYVDYYYFPAIATQRQLNYLTHERMGLDLKQHLPPAITAYKTDPFRRSLS